MPCSREVDSTSCQPGARVLISRGKTSFGCVIVVMGVVSFKSMRPCLNPLWHSGSSSCAVGPQHHGMCIWRLAQL